MLYRNQYKPKKVRGLFNLNDTERIKDQIQGYNPDDVTFPEPSTEPTDYAAKEPVKTLPVPPSEGIKESDAEQPKKKNWLSRLFGTTEEEPKVDEYGIEIPQKEKPNIGKRILEYAIPAIFGLAGGAGILPGIMGAMKQGKQRDINYVKEIGEYNKARQSARGAKLNEDYKLGMLDLAKQRFARTGGRGGAGGDAGDEEKAWASLSDDERRTVEKMTDNQLITSTGDADPITRKAANYVLKKRRKTLMGRQKPIETTSLVLPSLDE